MGKFPLGQSNNYATTKKESAESSDNLVHFIQKPAARRQTPVDRMDCRGRENDERRLDDRAEEMQEAGVSVKDRSFVEAG